MLVRIGSRVAESRLIVVIKLCEIEFCSPSCWRISANLALVKRSLCVRALVAGAAARLDGPLASTRTCAPHRYFIQKVYLLRRWDACQLVCWELRKLTHNTALRILIRCRCSTSSVMLPVLCNSSVGLSRALSQFESFICTV